MTGEIRNIDDGARLKPKPDLTKAQQRWRDMVNDADDSSELALQEITVALENWDIVVPGHGHGKLIGLIKNFRSDIEDKKRLLHE